MKLSERLLAGWPLIATLALALAGVAIRAGRRRNAVNEALHELRRPLQAMALISPNGTVQLALSALARVDAALNGGHRERRLGPVPCRALVEAAIGRWRSRARLAGGGSSCAGGLAYRYYEETAPSSQRRLTTCSSTRSSTGVR